MNRNLKNAMPRRRSIDARTALSLSLAVCAWLAPPRCGAAAVADLNDFARYQPILDRAPFGRAPRPGDIDYIDPAATAPAEAPVDEGPKLSDIVKVSMITTYKGTPAAAFTDTSTGKSYYMFGGDKLDDFEMVEICTSDSTVTVRRGSQQERLRLGGGAAPARAASAESAPSGLHDASAAAIMPPVAPRINFAARAGGADRALPAGVSLAGGASAPRQRSYSEMQRERAELAKKREELRKREQEAKDQKHDEEMAKLKRELTIKEAILTGKTPEGSEPLVLTKEEAERFAAEGYDLSGAGTAAGD